MISDRLEKMILVTFEVLGTDLTEAAQQMICYELSHYDFGDVERALQRCVRECRGRLSLADILSRIDDGHPSADEAWALLPSDEYASAVMTDEMAMAHQNTYNLDDRFARRKSFVDFYERFVRDSRNVHRRARWHFSPGFDPNSRVAVLQQAVADGRLTEGEAKLHYPAITSENSDIKLLEGETVDPNEVKEIIEKTKKKLGIDW